MPTSCFCVQENKKNGLTLHETMQYKLGNANSVQSATTQFINTFITLLANKIYLLKVKNKRKYGFKLLSETDNSI